jgi:hypothetical protein
MMKKRLPNTSFSFHDTIIDIADGNRAEVITTLRINGKIVDQQFTDAYELDIMVGKNALFGFTALVFHSSRRIEIVRILHARMDK